MIREDRNQRQAAKRPWRHGRHKKQLLPDIKAIRDPADIFDRRAIEDAKPMPALFAECKRSHYAGDSYPLQRLTEHDSERADHEMAAGINRKQVQEHAK